MVTRTTLKALWVGGGGILATWIAVSPKQGVPGSTTAPAPVRQSAAASEPTAEALNAQATRLRERTAAVTLRPSTRNPFRYKSSSTRRPTISDAPQLQPAPITPPAPAVPTGPVLKLSGIAQKDGKRTAIIAGEGQVYLVGEGDSLAGRYTVVKIDPEAVLLRDASDAEQRLILPH
jgi:type II secretory pathway component PulC